MKTWFKANRAFLIALLLFGFIRTALADWNPIPSGSMRPTLLEGDVVLVNRVAYALKIPLTDVAVLRLGEPRRGDVVTFTSPRDGMRLIKRLVAVPGDTVEMRDDRLFINGQAAQYDAMTAVQERLVDEKGEVRRFVNVYVNEEDIRFLQNRETPLKDGDEISIIPAIAGG